jgi:broad specificity phosphatase PhoE
MLVLWARHGQNAANLTRQFSHRRLDLDLTARGLGQAEGLAAALTARLGEVGAPPALFSSPLRRALQTAEIVATRLGATVEVIDGLREVNVGDLDGRADPEAWRIYESVLADWRQGHYQRSFPGGEDWHQLCARLRRALRAIAAAAPGDVAVVIAHGANLRAALPGLAHVADLGSDLICSAGLSRGKVRRPRDWVPRAPRLRRCVLVVSVSLATRGQTDMRGLVTAGRCSAGAGPRVWGRASPAASGRLLIGQTRVAPRAATAKGRGDEAVRGPG